MMFITCFLNILLNMFVDAKKKFFFTCIYSFEKIFVEQYISGFDTVHFDIARCYSLSSDNSHLSGDVYRTMTANNEN